MDKIPQPQAEFATAFDRELVAVEAAKTAQVLLAERIDTSLEAEERFTAIIDLMNELAAEDNGNRFIVEAIAQRLSYEKKVLELQNFEAVYPLAA